MKIIQQIFLFLSLALIFLPTVSAVPIGTFLLNNDESDSCASNMKILSWNIYMLPKMIVHPGKIERAFSIVQELRKSDFNIIVFQEAFLPKAREIIRKGLLNEYPYAYGPINEDPSPFLISSGVWVLSKIPLKPLNTILFRDCKTWDCYSRKGAVLLEGIWNGNKFQILGTHLQAQDGNDKIREKQMDQIYNELLIKYKTEGVPQIICGDMNTENQMKEYYCSMLECLDAEDGALSGLQKSSYDGFTNDIAQSLWGRKQTTLDYILLRKNGAKFNAVKRFISVMKKGKKQLSDHYAVECELSF